MVSYGEDEAYAVGRFEVFGHNSATELLRDRVGRDETKPPRAALAHGHSSFVPPMHDEVGALGNICGRSEEHTSELQSLMRNSYAVFCLKKKSKCADATIQQDARSE